MREIIKKGIIILSIYAIFTAYLFLVSERVERLDLEDDREIINVSLNYSES
jgi:hypothetical protein